MTACRAYWTCIGLLVAFNAMVWLTIANEVLRRADGPQGRSRVTRETRWLIADTAQRGLVVERDDGAAFMAERN